MREREREKERWKGESDHLVESNSWIRLEDPSVYLTHKSYYTFKFEQHRLITVRFTPFRIKHC